MKTLYPKQLLVIIICIMLSVNLLFAGNKSTFNVKDFGAVGNGTTLDSPSFNNAIEAAVKAGGGKVLVPSGKYLCGSIRMKSDINLCLEKGAVIVADKWNSTSYDPTEFFAPPAYQDGGHTYFHNSLIWGENLKNVSITGEGFIDGSGLTNWQGDLNKKLGFGKGSEGTEAAQPVDADKPTFAANKAISLKLCKNVVISGITILKGGWFAILVTGCDNIVMDKLTIDTNRDGIDIDCCKDVVVKNCKVNSPEDDGICPKSSYALKEQRLTENLTISNCEVSGYKVGSLLDGTKTPAEKRRNGRIKFGTESSGGFRNCKVTDCTFYSCMGLAIEEVDGAICENISFNNIKIYDAQNYGIYVVTGKRNRTPNLTSNSRMKNIRISNVLVEGVDKMCAIQIFGLPEQPLEAVSLSNITIKSNGGGSSEEAARVPKELGTGYPDPAGKPTMPAYGVYARHIKDLEMSNITFSYKNEDLRSAAIFVNVEGLKLDKFNAQVVKGAKVADFKDNVRNVKVFNSPDVK